MARNLMIQGTTSGAGKSFLAAGLCRLLRQDGLRVAPFKSQNMALNSFITEEGLEMGRAQVMQAEAAGIAPSVRMNPILLKPQSDTGSQVIVNGEVLGAMSAREYYAIKQTLVPGVLEAYRSLAEEYDVIVIEGAGSPAEINLREGDIVNMGLAELVDAPVLLAGDIDRGGVFASLYGTVALLQPEERARIGGLIINKFRGDPAILAPGLRMLEERAGIPVLGTVPMLDVDIEDEDSLAPRLSGGGKTAGVLDIAVIRFPRVSNFTDLHALEQIAGVVVRYVASARELASPDLIVLPGSKSTMADLRWLRECGLEAAVIKQSAAGVPVLGICGGYQMLGERLCDPEGVEGGGSMRGMGLLPTETVFAAHKVRTRTAGRVQTLCGALGALSGADIAGYEIHMGHTTLREGAVPFAMLEDGRADGAVCGNVLGSYLHGLFDEEGFTGALLRLLLARAGLLEDALRPVDYRAYKERQYDRMAEALREALDMEAVYRLIEKGPAEQEQATIALKTRLPESDRC